jgi:tetrahydromethanopterin S-methyltransferase subunit B
MSDISMLKAFEKNAEATKYWVNNQINPVKENIEEVEKRVSALENSSLEYTTTTSSAPALINS